MKKQTSIFIASLTTIMISVSCGSKDKTKDDTPTSTPTTKLTFNDVSKIINDNCATSCHSGTTPAGNLDFSTYASVKAVASKAAEEVADQEMPPPENSRNKTFFADKDSSAKLLEYLKAGAPE